MKIRIAARIDFTHEGIEYDKGEYYSLDESDARYVCAAGWAVDTTGKIKSAPLRQNDKQVVEPHNSRLDHRAIFDRNIKPVSNDG